MGFNFRNQMFQIKMLILPPNGTRPHKCVKKQHMLAAGHWALHLANIYPVLLVQFEEQTQTDFAKLRQEAKHNFF